jgi:hypothetical protein
MDLPPQLRRVRAARAGCPAARFHLGEVPNTRAPAVCASTVPTPRPSSHCSYPPTFSSHRRRSRFTPFLYHSCAARWPQGRR